MPPPRLLPAAISSALFGLGYAFLIEPGWLQTTHTDIRLARLPRTLDGYRIVQISDFHVDSWLGGARLRQTVAQVNALNPELIVITGDFASSGFQGVKDELRAALGQLRARDGVLAVLGNHDYHGHIGELTALLRACDVRLLVNEVAKVTESLYIAGVDDALEGRPDLDALRHQIPAGQVVILLAHEPDFADKARRVGVFDVQLSGHTHGGQIRIPGLTGRGLPPMGQHYVAGLYYVGAMQLYVNRGIGMTEIKARFRSRPEISVLTLRSVSS